MSRVFLLSPANLSGPRGQQLLLPAARDVFATRLANGGLPIADLFTFVSGLYFRGKITYAVRFATLPDVPSSARHSGGVSVITPAAGLQSPERVLTRRDVRRFAEINVDRDCAEYRRPLERSAKAFAKEIGANCEVVLLGSIATPKYVDVLLGVFGQRLLFPIAFVGRGDMSRGGLLLRKAREGVELEYVPVAGAVRHGTRPPRLEPYRKARMKDQG